MKIISIAKVSSSPTVENDLQQNVEYQSAGCEKAISLLPIHLHFWGGWCRSEYDSAILGIAFQLFGKVFDENWVVLCTDWLNHKLTGTEGFSDWKCDTSRNTNNKLHYLWTARWGTLAILLISENGIECLDDSAPFLLVTWFPARALRRAVAVKELKTSN